MAKQTVLPANGQALPKPEFSKNPDSEDEYDEEEDEDYDPSKKPEEVEASGDESEEAEPDYSAINGTVSQVRTRTQIYQQGLGGKSSKAATSGGLVKNESLVDMDTVYASLQDGADDEWHQVVGSGMSLPEESPKEEPLSLTMEKIRIETSYTFAGKLVRESKLVDADSAEAKAYLNSTSGIVGGGERDPSKSYVTVVRKIQGSEEQAPLIIKLKRPSLIDKFLLGDKKHKLTTLEKSRLDWASFVDKKSIKDDLALHNKAGYLEKQDFLGRMDAKRDEQYQKAKELERQRQWQLEQRSG